MPWRLDESSSYATGSAKVAWEPISAIRIYERIPHKVNSKNWDQDDTFSTIVSTLN